MKEWSVLLLSLTVVAFVLFAGAGTASAADGGKILIAYFSRADENYQVGYVEKGNTQVLAEAVVEATGGELFRIETERPYPKEYRETTEVAKREQNEGARPKLKSTPPDIGPYDVIFLGYPNWWGDMPMAVYTFLESYGSGAFAGKRIIPFCTAAGSGLSGTVGTIGKLCPGATVNNAFTMLGAEAQEFSEGARAKRSRAPARVSISTTAPAGGRPGTIPSLTGSPAIGSRGTRSSSPWS